MKKPMALLAALLLVAAGHGARPGVAGAQAAKIIVVSGRLGWLHSMPFFATELGLWQKYGLNVEHKDLGSDAGGLECRVFGRSP